jgi:hypothetical protein
MEFEGCLAENVIFFKVAGAQDWVFFHVFPIHYSPQLRSAATVSKWYIGISRIVDAKPGQVAEADAGRICKGASIAQLDLHRYQSLCLDIQVLVSILIILLWVSIFYLFTVYAIQESKLSVLDAFLQKSRPWPACFFFPSVFPTGQERFYGLRRDCSHSSSPWQRWPA